MSLLDATTWPHQLHAAHLGAGLIATVFLFLTTSQRLSKQQVVRYQPSRLNIHLNGIIPVFLLHGFGTSPKTICRHFLVVSHARYLAEVSLDACPPVGFASSGTGIVTVMS